MPGDGRFDGVGQTQLPQPNALIVGRQVVRRGSRQKAPRQHLHHVASRQLRGERAAHHGSPAAQHTDGKAFQVRLAEQPFLGGAAGAAQRVALAHTELGRVKLLFHAPRQRQVKVVSSQQQVLADCGSLKLHLAIDHADPNQAEVGRAAANVANQDQVAIRQLSSASACSGRSQRT